MSAQDYKVKDMSPETVTFGEREVELAEREMPGLMGVRARHNEEQPLAGKKISGSLHCTIQTAVLAETLMRLGANVRWCSCNIYSSQDHACAYMASKGIHVYAWKGESCDEYWECSFNALCYPDGTGPDQIVDDGGDLTLLVHRGCDAEDDITCLDRIDAEDHSDDSLALNRFLRKIVPQRPGFFHAVAANVKGVSEETTTGVNRMYQMKDEGVLRFPVVNVNDSVTKSKFDNVYGCRHSLVDGIMRATDVMVAGKTCVVCGYGDVGKGSVASLRGQGARVLVTEIDPICALQACMAGLKVARLEDTLGEASIFVTATGCLKVITAEHMSRMKDCSIVCNIGHFDHEIDVDGLKKWPGIQKFTIKPQVDCYVFPDGHRVILLADGRLVNLGCATGHPSFVMSCSFSNQTLAQIAIAKGEYAELGVHTLSKQLDEEVARLHLPHLCADLTTLSEEQSGYLAIPVQGPYKSEHYRY
eukprot:gnl/Trimastix_PCT/316.p2 GENE.gnl/Trimastix_PCT/316~~gnl/Trimastix_PCT/316.p2  ORF type:complete len:474 (+),score=161.56 gnl/Trimastix_PCT/316:58-1479(+)